MVLFDSWWFYLTVVVLQILEAADRIQAADMKKHALSIIVHNFAKVRLSVCLSLSLSVSLCYSLSLSLSPLLFLFLSPLSFSPLSLSLSVSLPSSLSVSLSSESVFSPFSLVVVCFFPLASLFLTLSLIHTRTHCLHISLQLNTAFAQNLIPLLLMTKPVHAIVCKNSDGSHWQSVELGERDFSGTVLAFLVVVSELYSVHCRRDQTPPPPTQGA